MGPFRFSLFGLILALALGLALTENASANVFASAIRITQEGSDLPFDGSFTDGTGAEIRFVLSDRADSIEVNIWTATNPTTIVRKITAYGFTAGDTSIVWDGNDDSASPVGAGQYRVVLATYDQGYADYTEIFYEQPAIFTRGVTAITNPALRNFGFIYSASNGGYVTGIARHAADGTEWGDVKGNAKLSNTGATVGPLNLRYSSEADQEGYVYLIGRDNAEVYRYHTDTLEVTMVDSGGYETTIQGIAVKGTGATRYLAIAGTEKVYGFPIGNEPGYFGPKDVLLDGGTTWVFWDVAWGRSPDDILGDSTLFATFYDAGDTILTGVAKFDLRGYDGTPLTMADTVWTAAVDTGRANTMVLARGIDMMGYEDKIYFTVARIASGNPPTGQGIFSVSALNTSPAVDLVYADKDENLTQFRSDLTLDAAGNIIYFENSNEEVVLISPPAGWNSFVTAGLDTILVFDAEPIADARASTVDYYVPDRMGDTVTVAGIVTSVNFTASANRFSYFIQDATAGINITKGGEPLGGPVYDIGDRLVVTGTVGQFAGQTQLEILSPLVDNVTLLGTGFSVSATEVTIPEYLADPETFEGLYINLMGVTKDVTSPAWPGAASSANMVLTDGFETLILRLDSDTEIPGQTEPTYPVNILGVGTQYSSSGTVDNGYQITPSFYTDFEQAVNVLPNPNFALLSPPDGATILLDSTSQTFTISWESALDLNGDELIYQWVPIGFSPVATGNGARDTFLVRTAEQLRSYLGSADTVELSWTVVTKESGPSQDLVYSNDTAMVRIVRGSITGVEGEEGLPTSFSLMQNYPNPFNPTTTIRYALPVQSTVTLRVYDVIGREVSTLVSGVVPAGYHDVAWTTTNSSGALLSSGMYFYRLEARPTDGSEPFVQLKKMMLLK